MTGDDTPNFFVHIDQTMGAFKARRAFTEYVTAVARQAPVRLQYSEDGTCWSDGETWHSKNGRWFWGSDGRKWEELPDDIAKVLVDELKAIERVMQGVNCEWRDCPDRATAIVGDTSTDENLFRYACKKHTQPGMTIRVNVK